MASSERQATKRAIRSRRRGGHGRAPIPVQRVARRVEGGATKVREAGELAVSGDRPLVVGLVLLLMLAVVTLSAPLQSYLDQSSRVDALSLKAQALGEENTTLTSQVDDLQNPLTIELLAREQQGLARPGDDVYTIVPPEVDRPQIAAENSLLEADDRPWYQRAWSWAGSLFG